MSNILPPVYPFDATGTASSNLIQNEQQPLYASNSLSYSLVIPTCGPYFQNSLVVSIKDPVSGIVSLLQEGIDYFSSYWFISASRACASSIYGGISFLNNQLSGILSLQYQTLGGEWTVNESTIASILANLANNPRTTAWEEVVMTYKNVIAGYFTVGETYLISSIGTTDFTLIGSSSNQVGTQFTATGPGAGTGVAISLTFPPTPHNWDLVDMVGMSDIVNAVNNLADKVAQSTVASENFLNAQAIQLSTPLTGYVIVEGGITPADSLITAIGKLDNANAAETNRAFSSEQQIMNIVTVLNNKFGIVNSTYQNEQQVEALIAAAPVSANISSLISTNITSLQGSLTSEFNNLQANVNSEISALQGSLNSDFNNLQANVNSEVTRAEAAEATLTNEINSLNTTFSNEIAGEVTNRNTAITNAINNEVANRNSAIAESIAGATLGNGGQAGRYVSEIIYVSSITPPAGFIKANGAVVSRVTFATLFTAIGTTYGAGDGSTTFQLPDLRGEFIRGFDDGRGIDTGRTFGSEQLDEFQGHEHTFINYETGVAGVAGGPPFTGVNTSTSAIVSDGINGSPRFGAETRPRNVAMLACICYNSALAMGQPSIPAGLIVHTASTVAPTGYIVADGSLISRSTFSALFTAIGTLYGAGDGSTTFALPDLRAEFIRGADNGRGIDTGRTIGSTQLDMFASHYHAIGISGGQGGVNGNNNLVGPPGGGEVTGNTGGTETRPRNIALLACISIGQ